MLISACHPALIDLLSILLSFPLPRTFKPIHYKDGSTPTAATSSAASAIWWSMLHSMVWTMLLYLTRSNRSVKCDNILLTKTLVVVFSETGTMAITEVLATTESLSSATCVGSLTSISSQFAVTSSAKYWILPLIPLSSLLFPITNYLPSLSVEQTATSSDSSTPTASVIVSRCS